MVLLIHVKSLSPVWGTLWDWSQSQHNTDQFNFQKDLYPAPSHGSTPHFHMSLYHTLLPITAPFSILFPVTEFDVQHLFAWPGLRPMAPVNLLVTPNQGWKGMKLQLTLPI